MAPALIIYDGDCIMCNSFIQFVLKRDGGFFKIADQNSMVFKQLLLNESLRRRSALSHGTIYLLKNSKVYDRSSAIVRILNHCGIWGNFLSIIISVFPSALSNRVYDLIARDRSLFFKKKSCLSQSAIKHRIADTI